MDEKIKAIILMLEVFKTMHLENITKEMSKDLSGIERELETLLNTSYDRKPCTKEYPIQEKIYIKNSFGNNILKSKLDRINFLRNESIRDLI